MELDHQSPCPDDKPHIGVALSEGNQFCYHRRPKSWLPFVTGECNKFCSSCFHVVALKCWANIRCVNVDCHGQNCFVVLYSKANSPDFISTANNHKETNCKSIWDGWEGCKVLTSKGCKLSMVCSLQILLQFNSCRNRKCLSSGLFQVNY